MDPQPSVALVAVILRCSDTVLTPLLGMTCDGHHLFVVCNDPLAIEETTEHHTWTLVHPGRNSGGAEGYRQGLTAAYEAGFTWIVTLDDDARAHSSTWITELRTIAEARGLAIVAPLIIATDRPGETAFPYWISGRRTWSAELVKGRGLIPAQYHPFNGTMFHRSVFDAVDLPDERFVINGEERDLFIRVRAAGLTTATATDVVISHPSGKGAMRPGFLGPFGAPIPRSRMKLAYQLRNRAFLTRRGRRVDWLLVDSVRYSLAALAQGPHRLRRWHELVRVYATGLSGHLGTLPEETLSAWPTGPGDKDLSCVRLQSARDGLAEG